MTARMYAWITPANDDRHAVVAKKMPCHKAVKRKRCSSQIDALRHNVNSWNVLQIRP